MPTTPRPQATRRLGGAILLLAALAFAATAIVPRIEFVRPDHYRFEVPLDRGVGKLEVDSRVLLAGLPIGRVTAADPARSEDGRFDVVAVQIAVDPRIRLGEGTAAQLVAPLLGTGTDVRLLPAGGTPLEEGATLPWIPPPDFLETLLGPERVRVIAAIEADFEGVAAWYEAHDEEIAGFFDEIAGNIDRVETDRRRDVERWTESWSQTRTGLDAIESSWRALQASVSRISEAWNRLVGNVEASSKRFGGVMPAGGGSLKQLELISSVPDFAHIESKVAAIEAVWAPLRPRWADLVSHLGGVAAVVRAELPYALANTTMAGNELTGLIDSAESDPLPIAGEALGVLLGLVPTGDQRVAMAKADALRDYVRAMMALREAVDAIDRVRVAGDGGGLAIPVELKRRLSQALADLADAERAAVQAWAPTP